MSRKMPDHPPPGRDRREKKCQLRRRCRRKPLRNWRGTPTNVAIPVCSQIFAVMLRPSAPAINWTAPLLNASFVIDDTNNQEHENGLTHLLCKQYVYNEASIRRKEMPDGCRFAIFELGFAE